jgi:small subunit ribosomal protein S17
MENTPEKRIRKMEGVVVSDKMDKTIVVKVDRIEKDAKYIKYHRFTRKFKAHDEDNAMKVGDKVVIEETRPISKDKKWKVVEKIA